jgi:peptide/nickel transport system substrate-binding protein
MQDTAIQIQTFAADAGFDVQINQVPASGYGAGRSDHSFQSFLLQDWAITLTPSYELNIYTAPGGTNNLGDWENADFYAAKAVGDALPDPYTAEAGEAWNAAEQLLVNEAPIVFIAQVQPNVAMRDTVEGFAWRSDNRVDFSSMSITED